MFKCFKIYPCGNGRHRRNVLRNVGEISCTQNRFIWKIPNFSSIKREKNLFIHSPEFFIMDHNHSLFLEPYGKLPSRSGQYQLLIGIAGHFSLEDWRNKFSGDEQRAIHEYSVKFGIIGKDTEISRFGVLHNCFRVDMLVPKYTVVLLERSELEKKNDQWLPEGRLHLFITVEDKNGTKESSNPLVEIGIKKMQEDFLDILKNGTTSDFVLRVGNEEFRSHRCVLAARSPVFLAMMTHETKEKNSGIVDIQDFDPDTFCHFLKYLYTGCLDDITPENAQLLYSAADKYQVCELKMLCLDHMLKTISVDNFCDVFALSLLYEEKDLINACSQFFMKNSSEITKTPNWEIFSHENSNVEMYMKLLAIGD